MISSRWPRPMGIMLSMALMPVCSGTLTPLRSMMPGAVVLDGPVLLRVHGALAVDGLAQGVDHTADQRLAHRHGDHLAGALDRIAFPDALVRSPA